MRRPRQTWGRLAALAAVAAVAMAVNPVKGDSLAGSAGTDVSLPKTDSQVTISGRGPFKALSVTVNQTQNLLNQAVSITWSGGTPTRPSPGQLFGSNYLQVMQCWGDDDGTNPQDPGPPPEQCEFGATDAVYGGVPNVEAAFPSGSKALQRSISQKGWPNFDPSAGAYDGRNLVWRPFKAVDGTEIGVPFNGNFNPEIEGGAYWLNPYFNVVTTNEIAGAKTGANGKGSTLFELDTGVESSGLGCGQQVEPTSGGGKRIPKCWLVIVPRGEPVDEDQGTSANDKASADEAGVITSPLAPAQWANRISIPLEFDPIDTACPLSANLRQIVGSQFAAPASSSWQPKLCENKALEPYVYGTIPDGSARDQIVNPQPGGPGMAVVSSPVAASKLDPTSPVVYAPLTLSGTVVAFNIERLPLTTAASDEQELAGVPISHLNLTPRLIAKLLTQSYQQQVKIEGSAPPYPWLKSNPSDLGADPDFLRFNPEFALLRAGGRNFSGFVAPQGNADGIQQLWAYVLADPEAKAWLDGAPDQWGMKVNPVYATAAAANSSGVAFGSPVPSSFPKSDPYCYQDPKKTGVTGSLVPPVVCGTDWMPYAGSFRDAAHVTRIADDGAKVVENVFAQSIDQVWTRDIPQPLGQRAILGISDSASAFQYGVQTASLSRAGDDGNGRNFIAADVNGFTAAVNAMKPKNDPAVLEPDPSVASSNAYPLTVLTYAALKPLSLDPTARQQYAAFINYAAADGQVPGQLIGDLPPGYAPLTPALATQAKDAATLIRTMTAPAQAAAAPAPSSSAPSPGQASDTSSPNVGAPSAATPLAVGAPAAASAPLPGAPLAAGAGGASAAGPESRRGLTPIVSTAITRFALPALGGLALVTALVALEITKRPRRGAGRGSSDTADPEGAGP